MYNYSIQNRVTYSGWRHAKKTNTFKASNVYFDANKVQAYSYDWWRFVEVIGGKVVFNNYRYSTTTGGHQRKTERLLEQLGIKVDLYVEAPKGLQDLHSAISHYENRIAELIAAINRPGSKQAKNAERAKAIQSNRERIEVIKKLIKKQGR